MLISVQRPRGLTSAAGDRGVQTGALCDVDLDHLLGTGRVDTYGLQKVGICCSTLEAQSKALCDFSGVWTGEMQTQDLLVSTPLTYHLRSRRC